MANKCKDCGCTCKRCISTDHDVQLHVEIEHLKQNLIEKENHIVTMETNFLNEANKFPCGEMVALREELMTWQDKYKRLYEAHRRVQRVNQGLEDKLLKLVDVCETEKTTLTKDVATLSQKLAESNYSIKKLTDENERYKSDVSLAIQFLQCKQSNFVAHRYDSLPPEVQSQVSNYMNVKKKPEERKPPPEMKSIKVPIPTFPPTAMVYSVPKSPNPERKASLTDIDSSPVDIVSAAIMAKVLEERQKERSLVKHCDTCTCAQNLKIVYDNSHHSVGTQTGDYKSMLCIRCNDSVQATESGLKIVRHPEPRTHKIVPIYPLENLEPSVIALPSNNNVVKVQPNNFLIDTKSIPNSMISSPAAMRKPKNDLINPNNHVLGNEVNIYQDSTFSKAQENIKHHQLCDKSNGLRFSSDTLSTENIVNDRNGNGPTLTDRQVNQIGTHNAAGNILLDNAQEIAPVLYTRNAKLQDNATGSSEGFNVSNDCRVNPCMSETSSQNQQRVAEWIQDNIEDDVSSSENSRSENFKSDAVMDKAKYAEMEENVRRFLFGESEFLKTVEIGKLKYQNLREADKNSKGGSTETDI